MHPLVKLAANASLGERRYVLFAGAGLSIDAGLPTAWGLMLATAELLRAGEETGDDGPIEEWFLASRYARDRYDQLVGGLFPTSAAQRDFMRLKLRADEPGNAHRQVAELARLGVIRCAITTNFDTLLEQALREVGLTVQVIANEEQLRTSGPLIQCKEFRLYKPHGTIEGGRLRNTPADLEKLSGPMERELARVVSDHGLIVLGYSGADPSIRRVFQRKRQYLYPTFWVNPSPPAPDIPPLFGSGTFDHIPCQGASAFLGNLTAMYRKLDAMVPRAGLEASAVAAEDSIRSGKPDGPARVKRFWERFDEELHALRPNSTTGFGDEALDAAIERVVPLNVQFARVAAAIAEMDALEAALSLFRGFERVISGYFLPRGVGGSYRDREFDFHRFVGHELFVTMISFLIREDRWETAAEVLNRELYVGNHPDSETKMVSYDYISQEVSWLLERDQQKRVVRHYHHAEVLEKRHTEGELGEAVPMAEFTAADYLLGLRIDIHSGSDPLRASWWGTWSAWYLNAVPRFFYEARRRDFAERLRQVLRLPDVPSLREAIRQHGKHDEKTYEIGRRIHPMHRFDSESIATI